MSQHLVLYDGVCGLCNRLNLFLLTRDVEGVFAFASLQSQTGQSLLRRFDKATEDLTTFYVIANYCAESPVLLAKSRAALFVASRLGGFWPAPVSSTSDHAPGAHPMRISRLKTTSTRTMSMIARAGVTSSAPLGIRGRPIHAAAPRIAKAAAAFGPNSPVSQPIRRRDGKAMPAIHAAAPTDPMD